MRKYIFVFLTIISCLNTGFSQQKDSLKTLVQLFNSFEYSKAINEANRLLKVQNQFKPYDIKEIYRMKAIAEYSTNEEDSAGSTFVNILKIEPAYQLDSSSTSPKIISFFNNVKEDYLKTVEKKAQAIAPRDTVYIPQYYIDNKAENEFKWAIAKSIVFPGWGHFSLGYRDKGLLFSSLTVLAIASTIYFIAETNKKSRDYYLETDLTKVLSKYNDYNQAYLKRNISIIALALIWAYTQFDLLFNTRREQPSTYSPELPSLRYNKRMGLNLSYRFQF